MCEMLEDGLDREGCGEEESHVWPSADWVHAAVCVFIAISDYAVTLMKVYSAK